MTLAVGLDGGGTKTAAAVVDDAGRVVGSALGGASSFKSVGLERAAGVLVEALGRALDGRAAGAVLAAVSDVDTTGDRDALRRALADKLAAAGLAVGRLDVANDAVAALASGTGGLARGIACIAGTGSVALGLDGRGGEARAGGWGPPFGDGGSAYYIGFQAIARALKRHDDGQRETLLLRELLSASGCGTLPELLFGHAGAGEEAANAAVYRERVAALARAVERAALAGDPDARLVFDQAGRELAELVRQVATRLDLGREACDVVLVGSVWDTAAPQLRGRFAAELAGLPGARLVSPAVEPSVGAALLAAELSRTGRPCPGGLIEER
jgi:N-acetylglucosamine kinase-like BadF-type ATPase